MIDNPADQPIIPVEREHHENTCTCGAPLPPSEDYCSLDCKREADL